MVGVRPQLITKKVINNLSNNYPINQDGAMTDPTIVQEEAVRNHIDYPALVESSESV